MFKKITDLLSLTKKENSEIDKDKIAKLLKVNPDLLANFESTYKEISLNDDIDDYNFFNINSKQMSKYKQDNEQYVFNVNDNLNEEIATLSDKIVNELLEKKPMLTREPKLTSSSNSYIKSEDLKYIPLSIRPQLTGHLITKDTSGNSYETLLLQYIRWKETNDVQYYHFFRQGLDILDLDAITYAILDNNPNTMGFWFSNVSSAAKLTKFFKIPDTKIIKVPLPILQLTRLDYQSLNRTTLDIVNKYCMKAFDLDVNKKYFIKTGTYSSKFDFRNALVQGEKEVEELGEYLLFIHHQALQMASSLNNKVIYGVSTTNEWVVREFIEDTENNPTIYKGLPLRTEYRFFVDLDNKEILGVSPYWREDVMKRAFSEGEENNHKKHDYIIYKMHEEKLYERYYNNVDKLTEEISKLIMNMKLTGQWSIDIMQNGEDFYLIDMALAHQSALKDCVNSSLLSNPEENWLSVMDVEVHQ